MKRIAIILLVLLTFNSFAQEKDVLETVKSDRELSSGHERAYDFATKPLTGAPKGYNPVYISHYGRHGSRYAWNQNYYTVVRDALQIAHKNNCLTREGSSLYDAYMDFCEIPIIDYGCIVPQGWGEQQKLAFRMFEHFPEVFRDGGKVFCQSSTSQRAVLSMTAFTLALQKSVPSLDIFAEALSSGLSVTKSQNPDSNAGPFYERGRNSASLETREAFIERKVKSDGLLSRLFTDSSFFRSDFEKTNFCLSLYYVWAGYRNYCKDGFLEGIFTAEEIANLWEVANYKDYKATVDDYNIEISRILGDIIAKADDALENHNRCADLRFGHDVVISMIIMFMNIYESNVIPQRPEDVKYFFQNWRIPMASNIQFVFYVPEQEGETLVKMLLNEEEILIPGLESADGPYYKWKTLKEYMLQVSFSYICNRK